jgi:hypothetical protein
MERRRVLLGATLASSYLVTDGKRGRRPVDVEQACAVLTDAVVMNESLRTERAHSALARVQERLRPYADQEAVKQLKHLLHSGRAAAADRDLPAGQRHVVRGS